MSERPGSLRHELSQPGCGGSVVAPLVSMRFDWWLVLVMAFRAHSADVSMREFDNLHAHRWLAHIGCHRCCHETVTPV